MSIISQSSSAYPAVKFKNLGDRVAGRIVAFEDYQQKEYEDDAKKGVKKGDLMFYPSGDPIMGCRVDLETVPGDAASRVSLYVQGKLLTKAVSSAVKGTGAPDLEIGGDIVVTHSGMQGRAKDYASAYSRPEAEAAAEAPAEDEPPF